jgi:MFS family permease
MPKADALVMLKSTGTRTGAPSTLGRVRALLTRDFAWLWAGQAISQIGDGVSKVALVWFVYSLTGSALQSTLIGVLETLPPLLFGPFAGVFLDRLPKRESMIVIDVVRAILLTLIPVLHTAGMLTLGWLYAIVFGNALFGMAFGPALNAAIPLIVKPHQLTRGNAVMQSTLTLGQLLGPATSGILIAVIGPHNVLYVNAAAFALSAACKMPLRLPEKRHDLKSVVSLTTLADDLRQGIHFIVREHPLLLLLMVSAGLFTLGTTGFVYLLPMIGERLLHIDSVRLGWLWSALSVGMLLATIWLAWKEQPPLCQRFSVIAGSAAAAGIAVWAFTTTQGFVTVLLLVLPIGISSGLVTPLVSASVQELTPRHLLARVFGVFNTGTMGLAMLGMTLFGWLADAFSPTFSLVGIAAVTAATGVLTAFFIRPCHRWSESGKKTSPASAA